MHDGGGVIFNANTRLHTTFRPRTRLNRLLQFITRQEKELRSRAETDYIRLYRVHWKSRTTHSDEMRPYTTDIKLWHGSSDIFSPDQTVKAGP